MTTRVDALDTSVQETTVWLNEIAERLGAPSNKHAYQALRAVLRAIRDRVGPDNALHLAAQLPLLIRGVYFEGWRPRETPTRERHLETFLEQVDSMQYRPLWVDPEAAVRVVLEVMAEHIDPGEVEKLARLVPEELRQLWPPPRAQRGSGISPAR